MSMTLEAGTLIVASAYPDPPFDIIEDNQFTGFDVHLMRALCAELKLKLQLIAFRGENFNNIFDGLQQKQYDAVISGTTITPARADIVLFSKPYLTFNQGIAVNTKLTPKISSIQDLHGLIAGIQKGNTSDEVAKKLLSAGNIADIHYYAYNQIEQALLDLEQGRIGLIIKLFPVLSSFVKKYPNLEVVMQMPTHEKIAIAFAKTNPDLCALIDAAIEKLKANGIFAELQQQWFGDLTKES